MLKKIFAVTLLFFSHLGYTANPLATLQQETDAINQLRKSGGDLSDYGDFTNTVKSTLCGMHKEGMNFNRTATEEETNLMRKAIMTAYLKDKKNLPKAFLPDQLLHHKEPYYIHCLFLISNHYAASYALKEESIYFLTLEELVQITLQNVEKNMPSYLKVYFKKLDKAAFIKRSLGENFMQLLKDLTQDYADIPHQWVIQTAEVIKPEEKNKWLLLPPTGHKEVSLIDKGFKVCISNSSINISESDLSNIVELRFNTNLFYIHKIPITIIPEEEEESLEELDNPPTVEKPDPRSTTVEPTLPKTQNKKDLRRQKTKQKLNEIRQQRVAPSSQESNSDNKNMSAEETFLLPTDNLSDEDKALEEDLKKNPLEVGNYFSATKPSRHKRREERKAKREAAAPLKKATKDQISTPAESAADFKMPVSSTATPVYTISVQELTAADTSEKEASNRVIITNAPKLAILKEKDGQWDAAFLPGNELIEPYTIQHTPQSITFFDGDKKYIADKNEKIVINGGKKTIELKVTMKMADFIKALKESGLYL